MAGRNQNPGRCRYYGYAQGFNALAARVENTVREELLP